MEGQPSSWKSLSLEVYFLTSLKNDNKTKGRQEAHLSTFVEAQVETIHNEIAILISLDAEDDSKFELE